MSFGGAVIVHRNSLGRHSAWRSIGHAVNHSFRPWHPDIDSPEPWFFIHIKRAARPDHKAADRRVGLSGEPAALRPVEAPGRALSATRSTIADGLGAVGHSKRHGRQAGSVLRPIWLPQARSMRYGSDLLAVDGRSFARSPAAACTTSPISRLVFT